MTCEIDGLVDANLIKLLLTIEMTQSFGGAAQALGVTQPAVSQQVKRIEAQLGRNLFRRTRRGVRLTVEGEAVIVYARAIIALSDDLRRLLDQPRPEEIAVGMSEDFCRTGLTSILWLFALAHPHVRVRVVSGTYETLSTAIDGKDVDIAIMRRFDRYPDARLLWRGELTWNGRPGFVFPVADPVPLILPLAPNPARDTPIEKLKAAGRSFVIRFESVGLAGIEAALAAGLGFCAGPRCMRLHGAAPLADGHGLPVLPDVEFVLVAAKPTMSDIAAVFTELMSSAARSGFGEDRPDARSHFGE